MKREGFAGLFKAVVHRMRPENATDDTTATVDDVDDMNALFLFTMLGAITILIVTGWWAWWRMR